MLLLDEPLAALDLKLRQAMQEELRRIHQEIGGTFVFVTHDQGEALALANRIAVMRDGRLEQVGTRAGDLRRAEDALRLDLHRRSQSACPGGAAAERSGSRPDRSSPMPDRMSEISVVVRPENLLALEPRRDRGDDARRRSPRHHLSRLTCEIQGRRAGGQAI